MKKLLILSLLTCLIVMSFAFGSDIDPMQTLVQKLVEYYARFPQEKIYIQTDKPYYLGGENIWFRAFLVNASGHKPSTLSKKVYVELLNESDSVVNRLLLNSADQKMNGSIHLPDSLQEGNYVLRAYTNWMLNFKPEYIFYKKLYIGSGIDDLDLSLSFVMNKDGSRPSAIDLWLRDLDKKPLPRQTGTVQVFNDGKIVKQTIFTTDDQGKTNISLEDVNQNDWSKAQVKIKYKSHIQSFYPPKTSDSLDIQFLPEGGNIVNGAESAIAFRAVDYLGQPVDIEGYVKNDNNNKITNFKTFHNGMGKFSFIPSRGKTYMAVVTLKGGREIMYPLPSINDGAYQLALVDEDDKMLKFRVALGDALYLKNVKTMILGTAHGLLCFASSGKDMYEVKIPKDSFPDGVAKFTLFNEQSMPVSERLVFIQHHNVKINIENEKPKYAAREAVNLQLKFKDGNGSPLTGYFSASVTDNGTVEIPKYGENILTRLLLSADLKGHIEDPGYYFESNQPAAKDALDLVMLTHGWSRFDWEDIMNKTYPATHYYLDSSLNITGKVNMRNGTPAKQFQVTLFADKWGGSDSTEHWGKGFAVDTTDDNGVFTFRNVHFTDSTQFFVQVLNKRGNDKDVKIDITQSTWPMLVTTLKPGNDEPDDAGKVRKYKYIFKEDILNSGRGLTLKTITIKSNKKPVNYDVSRRTSPNSSIVPYEQIEKVGNVNLVNVLLTVPGVTLRDGYVTIHGGRSDAIAAEPLLIVDGVPMTSPDPSVSATPAASDIPITGYGSSPFSTALNNIPYNTIDFIEVLKDADASIYGVRGGNGVVIVNTKKEVNQPYFITKGTKTFYLPGYHVSKEFYVPRYDIAETRNNPKPDMRPTIYWNGNIKPDASGKASLFFYTSDAKNNYTLVLEGVTTSGEIIHETATINRN